MRKKLTRLYKRAFAFLLAAVMVFSGSFAVDAAGKTNEEGDFTNLSGAADGTPSKVIGLKVKPRYYGTIYDSAKSQLLAVYDYAFSEFPTRTPYLPGKAENYKDAVTGLYVYNGVYYRFCSSTGSFVTLYRPVIFFDGIKDKETDLYAVNGRYYDYSRTTEDGRSYVTAYDEVFFFGCYPNYTAFEAAHGVKLDPAKERYDYFQKDGRAFNSYSSTAASGGRLYYGYANSEILLNSVELNIDWNAVTVGEKYLTPDNQLVYVGYETEVNGAVYPYTANVITADGSFLRTSPYDYPDYPVVKLGESAAIRIRAVYYTKTKTVDAQGETVITYNTYKTGPWSEKYTYTYQGLTTKEIPALSLTAVQDDKDIKVSWNQNDDVATYMLDYIFSNTPINVTAENWDDYHTSQSKAWDAVKAENPQAKHSYSSTSTSSTTTKIRWEEDKPFCYFMVKPSTLVREYNIKKFVYSNIAAVTAVPKGLNTPAISDFKVVKKENGSLVASWTPVDANIIIYAYEKPNFPAYYNYRILGAYAEVTDEEGKTREIYLDSAIDQVSRTIIDKEVKYQTASGTSGECSLYYLDPGKTYYFVAHTYDSTDKKIAKAEPVAVIDGIAYHYYTAMGPATNVVSGKQSPDKPQVVTLSGKTSIKLSLAGGSTGYEIYKKSGKKWKKLATTLDNHYVDEGLKEKKEYSYRVRSYYLDETTNKKGYSDYVYVTATTGTVNAIMLTASAKTAKSVKLSWNKVSGATKYEIYRSDECSGDPSKFYGRYDSGSGDTYITSEKFELVKTIKKASTTGYTDKSVKAGEDYSYIIKAYYENGKKTAFIFDYASVSMAAGIPKMVRAVNKGNSIKVSWTKDPYAKSYEVAYKKYDGNGNTDEKYYIVQSTTKAAYTIKDIVQGGYAEVKVRTIGKNGKYSSWSTVCQGVSLAGAKKVKASNVFVKNAAGEKIPAVKITWQKVSGAVYYQVYRSTKKPVYYADKKLYGAFGDLIAKESNDDESDNVNEVYYSDLENVKGSVTGTSAIDCAQLLNGVDYYYTVVAYGPYGTKLASYAVYDRQDYNIHRAYGSGSYSKVCFNTKLSVTAKASKGKVKLTWNQIPGVTTYTVYRAASKKGKYTKVATVKKGKGTWTDKKAKKGKTYYYKIVAVGKSALKNKLEITSTAKKVKAK